MNIKCLSYLKKYNADGNLGYFDSENRNCLVQVENGQPNGPPINGKALGSLARALKGAVRR